MKKKEIIQNIESIGVLFHEFMLAHESNLFKSYSKRKRLQKQMPYPTYCYLMFGETFAEYIKNKIK